MTTVQAMIDYLKAKPADMRVMFYVPGGYDDEGGAIDIGLEYTVVQPVGPKGDNCYPSPGNRCSLDIAGEDVTGVACELAIVFRDANYG